MIDLEEVKVIWSDTKSYNGEWTDLESIRCFDVEVCNTKGYIVHETADLLSIAQSISESHAYNIMVIPKGCKRRRNYCT